MDIQLVFTSNESHFLCKKEDITIHMTLNIMNMDFNIVDINQHYTNNTILDMIDKLLHPNMKMMDKYYNNHFHIEDKSC